ncbi:MAG: hypothetical protein ACOC3T_04075 [Bacteroidota bacterium]
MGNIKQDKSWQKYSAEVYNVFCLFGISDSITSYYTNFNYINFQHTYSVYDSSEQTETTSYLYELLENRVLLLKKQNKRYSIKAIIYTDNKDTAKLKNRLLEKNYRLKDSTFTNNIIDIEFKGYDSSVIRNYPIDLKGKSKWIINISPELGEKLCYIPIDSTSADSVKDNVLVKLTDWKLFSDKNKFSDSVIIISPPSICYKIFWDSIAKSQDHDIFSYITNNSWQKKWDLFEKSLLNKAASIKYNTTEEKNALSVLDSCLKMIRQHSDTGIALIPVAAYLVYQEKEPVWFICCKWEGISKNEYLFLSHIRGWCIRVSDLKPICFETCG